MNRNENPRQPAEPLNVADQNVERLLGLVYQPETANPEFVARLQAQLCAVARQEAQDRKTHV